MMVRATSITWNYFLWGDTETSLMAIYFADNIVLMSERTQDLENMTETFGDEADKIGLHINTDSKDHESCTALLYYS